MVAAAAADISGDAPESLFAPDSVFASGNFISTFCLAFLFMPEFLPCLVRRYL